MLTAVEGAYPQLSQLSGRGRWSTAYALLGQSTGQTSRAVSQSAGGYRCGAPAILIHSLRIGRLTGHVESVDTGSTISTGTLSGTERSRLAGWVATKICTLTAERVQMRGKKALWVLIAGQVVQHLFWLASIQDECITGLDLLARWVAATGDVSRVAALPGCWNCGPSHSWGGWVIDLRGFSRLHAGPKSADAAHQREAVHSPTNPCAVTLDRDHTHTPKSSTRLSF